MNFVLDASYALTWFLTDESSEKTRPLMDALVAGASAFVPPLWFWEVGNALLKYERHQRGSAAEVNGYVRNLNSLPIRTDTESINHVWNTTPLLARNHRLSIYDASYLELAIRHRLPLATLNNPLISAARAEGVEVV